VRSQINSKCLHEIVAWESVDTSKFETNSFHEKAGECQVCFSFFLSCKDVFVLLFLPVSSCP